MHITRKDMNESNINYWSLLTTCSLKSNRASSQKLFGLFFLTVVTQKAGLGITAAQPLIKAKATICKLLKDSREKELQLSMFHNSPIGRCLPIKMWKHDAVSQSVHSCVWSKETLGCRDSGWGQKWGQMLSDPDFCGYDDIQIIADTHASPPPHTHTQIHIQDMHKHLFCFKYASTGLFLSHTQTHTPTKKKKKMQGHTHAHTNLKITAQHASVEQMGS